MTLSNTITGTRATLTKEDTNTLIVAGTDSHIGGTTVNDGTFVLNGISSDTVSTLTVNTHTLTVPATLGGNGTNKGPVMVNDRFWPGAGGTPSTFTAAGGLHGHRPVNGLQLWAARRMRAAGSTTC